MCTNTVRRQYEEVNKIAYSVRREKRYLIIGDCIEFQIVMTVLLLNK